MLTASDSTSPERSTWKSVYWSGLNGIAQESFSWPPLWLLLAVIAALSASALISYRVGHHTADKMMGYDFLALASSGEKDLADLIATFPKKVSRSAGSETMKGKRSAYIEWAKGSGRTSKTLR